MYKHKIFSVHPRKLLKTKGSFKPISHLHHSKHTGHGMINPMDYYLLSLVDGVRNNMRLSKRHHKGSGETKKSHHHNHKNSALKFIR
jgi:hypothetical protein